MPSVFVMTLEKKRAQARQWLAWRKSLAHLGARYLLYTPSPRLFIKPKQRLILCNTQEQIKASTLFISSAKPCAMVEQFPPMENG
jgi:hypothetical protein